MFLYERFLTSRTLVLYTESAQSIGCGAIYSTKWLYGVFPSSWHSFNITFLELYPIVLAVNLWGSLWKNHCILFFTDNEALTFIINRQSSKDTDILKLVCCLVLACLHYNILFQAKHIRGQKCTSRRALQTEAGQIQAIKPSRQSYANTSPVISSTGEYYSTLSKLLQSSLASNSLDIYNRAWSVFLGILNLSSWDIYRPPCFGRNKLLICCLPTSYKTSTINYLYLSLRNRSCT